MTEFVVWFIAENEMINKQRNFDAKVPDAGAHKVHSKFVV